MKRSSAWILGLGLLAAAPAASLLPLSGFVSTAMAAEDVSFDNVSFTFGGATVAIPHITVSGSTLSKGALQALVSGPWSTSTADTLAKFDASSIVIPEIHFDVAPPASNNKAATTKISGVYRDLRLDDITAGKASRVSSSGMTEEVTAAAAPVKVTMGAFHATDYDLAAAVRFVYGTAAPGETPKVVTGPATIDGMQIKGPQGVEVSIGKLATGSMKVRPLATPMASIMTTAMAATPGKPLPPAEAAKMMSFVADFYDAFAVDGMTVSDVSVKAPDPSFQGASLKTIKFGPIANSRFEEMGIEGLEVNASGGHVKLGRVALLGMDLKPFLTTMASLAKSGNVSDEAMKNVDWRNAIPRVDGIVVKDVDIDIPQGAAPQTFKLGGYELKLGNYIGSIPTSLRTELDNLVADASLFKEGAQQLMALGYSSLDLSSIADLAWNEAAKSIMINEISAKGANMGSVTLKGALGNVPRQLFAGSMPEMQVAALGVTFSEATLRVENGGLLDKLAALMAKAQGTTADKLRAQWGTQAALGIPAILGDSDKAKQLGNAVATFIANPKTLQISVKAKSAGGLGLTDVLAGGTPNPAAIFQKLDVTASANQ